MSLPEFLLILSVTVFSPEAPQGVTTQSVVAANLDEGKCLALRLETAKAFSEASSAQLSNGSRILLTTACVAEKDHVK